jgi:hypothetical protein
LAHFLTFCKKALKVLGNAYTFHSKTQTKENARFGGKYAVFHFVRFLRTFSLSVKSMVLFTKS